ncbi:hypothetical protein TTHERM_00675810 (macronuclear) [Tetrahymena thermophila SB210]|uniref:Uncharacterized protein n=1 Tax=Tetrahymena thermophila (strain SB210) TaxID=312017 RepID=Q23DX9_TETTS|nr:hypothetical protein TTHERM_00675810 [Tetrahymena thermophila SB210]EAR94808.2 hypothetical protein TTHERM_00675810 [Tetrahymena thermophila SB210]|eukprot:XP_001015053.2 hypothetical protein TTHERM_00675810 [Tetrahymena thermophila SB210]
MHKNLGEIRICLNQKENYIIINKRGVDMCVSINYSNKISYQVSGNHRVLVLYSLSGNLKHYLKYLSYKY